MYRIISNILIILSVFLMPVYISFLLIISAVIVFGNFIEAIIFGFMIDIIYGSGSIFGVHFAYLFTTIILVLYLFSFKFKKILRLFIQ